MGKEAERMKKSCEYFMMARVKDDTSSLIVELPYCKLIQKTLDHFNYCIRCSNYKKR